MHLRKQQLGRPLRRGFSLPELLLTIGIITLLMAILLPQLQYAHRQAKQTRCQAQLSELGRALTFTLDEYKYYPIWDDLGRPNRYTWIDVLLQRRQLASRAAIGKCPEDGQPGEIMAARGGFYGVSQRYHPGVPGLDYSYGIGVPLSAAGWVSAGTNGDKNRWFEKHDINQSGRVLAADGTWSFVYNLSGDTVKGHAWNYPTQFDNTIDWRHRDHSANVLYQDAHVDRVHFDVTAPEPVNTTHTYVWQPNEKINVGPQDSMAGYFYPNEPPVNIANGVSPIPFPQEVVPGYYTQTNSWALYLE